MRVLKFALVAAAIGLVLPAGAFAAEEMVEPPAQEWQHKGPFGTYDRAAAQRGFQVYREVCAGCHSMRLIAFRDLMGLGFSADEVKALAAEYTVMDGPDDSGEMFERPGLPSDRLPSPFANEQAARAANGGAYPPDLSLIVEARPGAEDYISGVLTGYREPPADVVLMPGMYYNLYFPGHQIAMPPPLNEGGVTYADGTPATVEQMAHDVTTFLAWATEPQLEERKTMGVKVMLFLLVFTGLMFAVKRRVWADVH